MDPAQEPHKQLLYAIVPHGTFPFGLGFAALSKLNDQVFQLGGVVVASAVQRVPLLRHVIGWIGGVEATPAGVDAALAAGASLAVAPGGIGEMYWGYPRPGCLPDEEYALLNGRKGFVRMALRHGIPLVPVYVFGNTKMFRRVELPPWVEAFSRAVQTSIVLFWGRWGLPVPFRTPLLYAIGAPLDSHLYQGGAGEDNEAQVDVLHAQFCDALVKLFDSHKADYGWAHKTLRVV